MPPRTCPPGGLSHCERFAGHAFKQSEQDSEQRDTCGEFSTSSCARTASHESQDSEQSRASQPIRAHQRCRASQVLESAKTGERSVPIRGACARPVHVLFHRYYRANNFRRVTRSHNIASVTRKIRWSVVATAYRAPARHVAPVPGGWPNEPTPASRAFEGQLGRSGRQSCQESGMGFYTDHPNHKDRAGKIHRCVA